MAVDGIDFHLKIVGHQEILDNLDTAPVKKQNHKLCMFDVHPIICIS